MKVDSKVFSFFLTLFIGIILIIYISYKENLEKITYVSNNYIIDVSHDYSCDFMVLQENLDLSGEGLENKINKICYEEQQNTILPMS